MPLLKELVGMTPLPTSYQPVLVSHEILSPVADPQSATRSPRDTRDTSSPTTTILFQLPTNSELSFKIFWLDFEGEKTVFNELRGAGAQYEQITTAGYASSNINHRFDVCFE